MHLRVAIAGTNTRMPATRAVLMLYAATTTGEGTFGRRGRPVRRGRDTGHQRVGGKQFQWLDELDVQLARHISNNPVHPCSSVVIHTFV
jgi:hypothetical protein